MASLWPGLVSVSRYLTAKYPGYRLIVCAGGITFPIITHALLTTIGFEKTLRISGLICLVTCTLATMCVSSNREHSIANRGPWLNARGIFDTKFLMLTSACMIVAFGKHVRVFCSRISFAEKVEQAFLPLTSISSSMPPPRAFPPSPFMSSQL